MRIVTVGGFRLYRRDKLPIRLTTRKAEALFAYLAIKGGPVPREVLADLLWGDVPTPQARHSLRQTLTELRASLRHVDSAVLMAEDDVIEVDMRRVLVDVHVVERLHGRTTEWALGMACALCRGEFLAGLDVKEAGFERWVRLERARVRQLSIEVHDDYVGYLVQRRQWTKAVETAIRLLALDPLSERAHCTLMSLYAQQGQLAAALRQYELCAEMLRRELSVDPSLETQQLRLELISRGAGKSALGGRKK